MRDIEAEAQEEKRTKGIGAFMERLGTGGGLGKLEGGVMTGISIRFPTEEDPGTLLVLRASGTGGKYVSFVGAYRLCDALLAWRARSKAGRMKWRVDVPWSQRETR